MKSYTFKVKKMDDELGLYTTILALHMPFESFFESVRVTNVLKDFCDKSNDDLIVTCCDYYYYDSNNEKNYLIIDKFFANLSLFYKANNLKEFLADEGCVGWLNEYPNDVLNEEVSEHESV